MTIELEDGRPPEWMIALENKQKRQHKLAHDVGAGAPCLNCNDGCSGLDLHFWRKICRNCKCKKEVHDVKEENSFEQFEILFGDNVSDRVKKISLNLKFKLGDLYGSKEAPSKDANATMKCDNDLTFDWIPTDVPVNLASEYLQQLPLEKLPITGSAGAMFRRQQLQKQIPLHDFKVNDCHDLTDEETVAFMEYLDNLKNHAVGKGQITKILPTPDEAPDKCFPKLPAFPSNLNSSPKPFKCFSETSKSAADEDLPPPPADFLHPTTDLKTPSAFKPYKKLNAKFLPQNDNANNNVPFTTENFIYDKYVESSTPVAGLTAQYTEKLSLNVNEKDSQNNNWCTDDEPIRSRESENPTPSEIIRKLNSRPAAGPVSDLEKNEIRNPSQFHDDSTTVVNNRNLSPSKNVDGKFMKIANPEAFVAVSSYVASTPQLANTLTGARGSSRGPKVRFGAATVYSDDESADPEKQLCPIPSTVVTSSQNELNMDCHQCKKMVLPSQVVVVAERAGVEVIWHPQCFVCVICQELLVDLVYFFHRGEVYCGRHYAEVLKIPRCFACDELIFLKEYTVAENQTFHVKHFCCFECDEPLAGKQYVPKDGNPVCLPCYEAKYGKQCNYCEETIKAGDSRVGWKEFSWHATAFCFKCIQCSKSLLGGKFVVKNNSPLCSKECVLKFNVG